MGKIWRFHPHDEQRITGLEHSAKVPAVVAQLLLCRGIYEPQSATEFLNTKLTSLRDPDMLPGLAAAADLIQAAIADGKRIVVYGDYDADGMTGTATLLRCLTLLGADAGYYVPNRIDEGYGLNNEALRKLAKLGTHMVITVDCGIASVDEAKTAAELGLQLIITDHHAFADELPSAAGIVHPRLPGSSYPFGDLCGSGVAFKLAWALCQRASNAKKVGEPMRRFLIMAVGLAAIGTVADMVSLVDENRAIVRHGLLSLKERPPLGLEALMKVTGLDSKSQLDSEDIGFTLGPRLNAAGRLGQAQLAVELMVTESEERATALAEYIHGLNETRQSLERSIYLSAMKQAKEKFDPENDAALVLAEREWHPGVIGIVAGRLAEKFGRPVALIALDKLGVKPGGGSARSGCGVNLHAALAACSEHLNTHGGHAAAAGLTIDEAKIDQFRADFCEYIAEETSVAERTAELQIDAETSLSQLTLATIHQIQRLAPFGSGNPRPLFCTTGVTLAAEPKRMGGGERHLSVQLNHCGTKIRAVAFGQGDWADELAQVKDPFDIAYRPVINAFRGRQTVELHLVDWRRTPANVAVPQA